MDLPENTITFDDYNTLHGYNAYVVVCGSCGGKTTSSINSQDKIVKITDPDDLGRCRYCGRPQLSLTTSPDGQYIRLTDTTV